MSMYVVCEVKAKIEGISDVGAVPVALPRAARVAASSSSSSMLLHSDARNKQCTQYAFASGRASRAKERKRLE